MSLNGAFAEEESVQRIPIIVSGLEGYAEKSCGGWDFYGKWASHTGYRHTHGSELDKEGLQHVAEELYREQSPLCYLIGDEHKEFGWKKVRINMHGHVEIRLPQWADTAIKDALSSLGVCMSCPSNCYWVFPSDVELYQAKEVLEPLLQPNTRFANETDLARKLLENFPSSELGFRETQLSLF